MAVEADMATSCAAKGATSLVARWSGSCRTWAQGVVRGKKVITTNPDAAQPCPDAKVNRAFVADMPNQLWVSDFTYVSSWQGMVYVAFVINVFARKIVGWRVATSMP